MGRHSASPNQLVTPFNGLLAVWYQLHRDSPMLTLQQSQQAEDSRVLRLELINCLVFLISLKLQVLYAILTTFIGLLVRKPTICIIPLSHHFNVQYHSICNIIDLLLNICKNNVSNRNNYHRSYKLFSSSRQTW